MINPVGNLGDYVEDATLDVYFHSIDTSSDPMVPATLSGTPAISVYKANSTTQSTAGVTLTADFDSVTGLNQVRIDTSADAFYTTAADYAVVVTTGTVGGNAVVGTVVATFSIENRSHALASVCTELRLAELDAGNLPADIAALPTAAQNRAEMDSNSTELAAIKADTNELQTDDIPAMINALNDIAASDILTTALTQDYASDGAQFTLSQALYMIWSLIAENSSSGTTITAKKLDGSTTSMTFTIDDASDPTGITRAT